MKRIAIFLLCLLLTGCTNTLSKEMLTKGFANYESSSLNESVYRININEDYIIIKSSEYEYEMKYDLNGNPTFIVETAIEKGITYDEYIIKTTATSLPIIAFIAVANTYDIPPEDAYIYYSQAYLEGITKYSNLLPQYIISEDNPYNDENIILTSEFGNKVLEYTKSMYNNKINIRDEKNDLFEYNLANTCDDNKCVIKAKLVINYSDSFKNIISK